MSSFDGPCTDGLYHTITFTLTAVIADGAAMVNMVHGSTAMLDRRCADDLLASYLPGDAVAVDARRVGDSFHFVAFQIVITIKGAA